MWGTFERKHLPKCSSKLYTRKDTKFWFDASCLFAWCDQFCELSKNPLIWGTTLFEVRKPFWKIRLCTLTCQRSKLPFQTYNQSQEPPVEQSLSPDSGSRTYLISLSHERGASDSSASHWTVCFWYTARENISLVINQNIRKLWNVCGRGKERTCIASIS